MRGFGNNGRVTDGTVDRTERLRFDFVPLTVYPPQVRDRLIAFQVAANRMQL